MRLSSGRWAIVWGVALTGALILAGCSEHDDDSEDPGSATVEIPTSQASDDLEGSETGSEAEPAEPGHDAGQDEEGHERNEHDHFHDEVAGDLDDVPDAQELERAFEVAEDFWEAYQTQVYDHEDGVHQWIERVRPYVTDRYYTEDAEPLYEASGGVAWDEVFHGRQDTVVQVRDAIFDPTFAFISTRIAVTVEYAIVVATADEAVRFSDHPSQIRVVIVEHTDQGWRVDQVLASGQSGAAAN